MTVVLLSSRSLAQQLLASPDNDHFSYPSKTGKLGALFQHARTYATAPAKPASRPKQHTGRTPAKRTSASTKKAAPAKKPAAKATKKPVAKKPKNFLMIRRPPRVKKEPSKAALLTKARKDQADLKALALLEEPKRLAFTAFLVILMEESQGKKGGVIVAGTAASNKYKNLTLEERERYNHVANQNKAQNEQAYKKWVQSHTPLRIKKANTARRQLSKKAKLAGKKTRYHPIQDDRIVRQPSTSYVHFTKERNNSGDLAGMTLGERGKLIAQEWKKLSATQMKPFEDQAEADRNRYVEEYKTVYGEDPPKVRVKATKTS